ncbi:S8 family peptidase [Solirubrobacter taibaiensis]|nr:S8 family peptidase [Solirubrobacter taibaiensis]
MNTFAKAVGLVATGALILAAPASADEGQILRENAANAIPGSYVVVLDDAAVAGRPTDEIAALGEQYGADVEHQYANTVQGFSAEMTREEALALSTDPAVKYVEQDRVFETQATQTPATWGLDRLDQRTLPFDSKFTYPDSAGAGVTAYIIDTGIRTTHSEFAGGRALWGTNTTGDGQNTDCNGHGTHVAGSVGGKTYGVAKGVKLIAVKVLDCAGSGSFAGVMAGIDWVTGNHTSGPAVANMSLGASGADVGVENAIRASIIDGITYTIAAGNSNANACNFTPARVAEAITVNASTSTDTRASFSNFGTCTDLFAPGQNILSAWNTSDTATNAISGTSMAAPHVAGAAALVLGATPNATPAQVGATLINNATPNVLANVGTGSPNRLLNIGGAPVTPPVPSCAKTNDADVSVPDNTTVFSDITISGCQRNASATAKVTTDIRHTYKGDLVVEVIAPDGSVYVLHNRAGGSADNIQQTFTVNLSTEPANGTWRLRVRDAASADTGYINSWTLEP